jgi:iron complex outermembrane receptor protein
MGAACTWLTLSAAGADSATPASSDVGELSEVLVTASRFGAENLQKVPIAITALDSDTLEREGLQSLPDITRMAPGITVQDAGGGQNTIIIRGISSVGTADATNVEDQTTVSVYLDDTPISLAGATPDLRVFDLERVEIVRGPQGTLYGAGAMAGNIRYITKKPSTDAFDATAQVSSMWTHYGDAGYSVRGMVNQPITDTMAVRISAYQGRDSGFIDNVLTHDDNVNFQDNTQLRAAFRWDDRGPLKIDASYLFSGVHTGSNNSVYSNLGDYQTSYLSPTSYHDQLHLFNVTANYHLDQFDSVSSTSYLRRHNVFHGDGAVVAGYFLSLADTLSSPTYENAIKDFSQELRLTGRWEHFRGQIGGFFEDQRRLYTQDYPTSGADAVIGVPSQELGAFGPDDIFSEYQRPKTRQVAVFAEATYSPIDQLDLTAGIRRFHWRQSFSLYSAGAFGINPATGTPLTGNGESKEQGSNPKANVTYHVTDDAMVFVEAAKGFRYGGINQPVPISLCAADLAAAGLADSPATYGPDHVWTYSLGEKATTLGKRLTLNTTAFLTNWSDVQTKHNLNTCGYYYERNKGEVRSTGLELESQFAATSQLTLGLSAAYTHAVTNGAIIDLDAPGGARVPYFPRVSTTVQVDYKQATSFGPLTFHADFNYRGDMVTDFDAANTLFYRVIPSSRVLNAAITYAPGKTEWTLYGRNLANDRIIIANSGNPYGAAQPLGDSLTVGRPLTIGLQAGIHF